MKAIYYFVWIFLLVAVLIIASTIFCDSEYAAAITSGFGLIVLFGRKKVFGLLDNLRGVKDTEQK